MKDYYEILEVSRKASKDTINKVFKMHMKANHPDLFQGEEKVKAEEKSKELTEAYNILSDDNERAKYDAQLEEEESANTSQLQAIINENEYLKQIIAQKDEYISRMTNTQNPQYAQYNQYDNYSNNQYSNPYANQYQNGYSGFNGFTPPQPQDPYAGMSLEELQQLKKEQTKQYYKEKFKDIGVKLILLVLLMAVLLISLISSFRDLTSMLK